MSTDLAQLTPQATEKIIAQMVRDRERHNRRRLNNSEEVATYQRQYRQEHSEELRQKRQHNRPKRAEQERQYHTEHSEELTVKRRQYCEEHKEEITANAHRYYKEHLEARTEQMRQYHEKHPEVSKAASARRQALLIGADGSFTAEEFSLLCEVYENKCTYCHNELPLTPDHAIPLSKGGNNSIDNIVPACMSCNKRKHTMTYDEYMERLSKEALS